MAKPREEDLRRAKDNAFAVVTEQQKKLGCFDAGGRAVDAFIAPILEKIARTDSEQVKPAPEPVEREPIGDVSFAELGSYDWNLATNEFTAHAGAYVPTAEERLRVFIRFLMAQPEASQALIKVSRVCMRHTTLRKDCTHCERRELRFRQIVRQCAVKYGYGHHAPAPKIIVGGQ